MTTAPCNPVIFLSTQLPQHKHTHTNNGSREIKVSTARSHWLCVCSSYRKHVNQYRAEYLFTWWLCRYNVAYQVLFIFRMPVCAFARLSLRGWLLQYWPPVCAQKDRAERVLLRRCQSVRSDSNVTSPNSSRGVYLLKRARAGSQYRNRPSKVKSGVRFTDQPSDLWLSAGLHRQCR